LPDGGLITSQLSDGVRNTAGSDLERDAIKNRGKTYPKYLKNPIWLVERQPQREFYSNRLQIITTHTVPNIPRQYCRFPRNTKDLSARNQTTNRITGILYHASESDILPLKPEMNTSIKKYSQSLLKYVVRKKCYHYFIDRFGRVYRVVQEDHAAYHAGNSIWADDEEIYLSLNHAFIGICFEGKDFFETDKTKPSPSPRYKPTGISWLNEAQLRSGKELTDWLRIKHNIPQGNCVPHALASVNPDNKLVGHHLDLSKGFPFASFGLSNKYREPLPSIVEFGFLHDGYFERVFDGEIWPGIGLSVQILKQQARNSGMSVSAYRKHLHHKFERYEKWKEGMFEGKENQLVESPQIPVGNGKPG
jgi:hypothetical protein